MTKQQIASTLKQLRIKTGLTQKQVADQVGKRYQTVASWESAKGQPDADTFLFLCQLYNVENILETFRGVQSVKNNDVNIPKIPRINEALHEKIDKLDADDFRTTEASVDSMLKAAKYTTAATKVESARERA